MFDQPQVGKTVRVTTRYPEHYYWASSPWRDNTYEGTVMAPDRTVPQGSFLLHTPNTPEYPMRVIALARVIDLMYQDGTQVGQSTVDNAVRVWQVQGSGNNVYTVTQERGQRRCTCPGFTFRKNCRHILKEAA